MGSSEKRRHFPLILAGFLSACREVPPASAGASSYDGFLPPESVTITGYAGDAMEPFLTRDGRYLLFNNRNDANENTNLHCAERVDDLTFSYQGEIPNVNTQALEGVPSVDREGNLYFVSTRSYDQTWSTIYRAKFANGSATKPELVEGVSRSKPGWVNFDAEISADGNTLYLVDAYFGAKGQPQSAKLLTATRTGKRFHRAEESDKIFAQVNSSWLQYAPSISEDELELFLTRVERITKDAEPAIFRSTRKSIQEPFSNPQRISAIQGFAEAATVAPGGKAVYYHARIEGKFRIRRVARRQ